ncbi:MAG: glycosyltransferase, partial [Oscillospiraceae bacterium]|nr:glycosyltransferase [Oscillospiraceae bacterium]
MEHLVSIIVPVYKVENVVQRCIKSITAQTYKNIEIIIVDDGSPDGSGAICDSLAQDDSRIKVFHLKNGGVSYARNFGIQNAAGDLLAFVDADDLIMPT